MESHSISYSGTFVNDLIDAVETRQNEGLDSTLLTFQDPALYLASVKTHLANKRPMTKGDVQAYVICAELQECLFDPKKPVPAFPICFACGEMFVWSSERFRQYIKRNFLCAPCNGEDCS